jgi:hypothetical protein
LRALIIIAGGLGGGVGELVGLGRLGKINSTNFSTTPYGLLTNSLALTRRLVATRGYGAM